MTWRCEECGHDQDDSLGMIKTLILILAGMGLGLGILLLKGIIA